MQWQRARSVAQPCLILYDPTDCSHQAPLSMEFSRQDDWSGLPLPTPGDLPDSGIEPMSPALQVDSLLLRHQGSLNIDSQWFFRLLHMDDSDDEGDDNNHS